MSDAAVAHGRRVLVVDDHECCRESLADLLSDLGCDVRVAGTGREALLLAARFFPDVVLLDLGLPDLHGYAVADAIKADPATAGAFIIAVTGYDESSYLQQTASLDTILLKPVPMASLFAAVAASRPAAGTGTGAASDAAGGRL
jgi:CheY-like chemotaxis protein